ncbi:MAG TPA: SMC-Scp complex subunit ScpB [Thermoplasmata archaeon]|nr:SMC-Scp complex subunit ScpB [Thermoplasmata archaeon]
MPAKVDPLVLRVEAILFAAGKPRSVHELAEALDLDDHRPVQRALKLLARAYDGRQTALEVRHVGDRYALQLRTEYVEAVQAVTPVELPPRTLKALTLIAYHQPMLQSLLARMLGDAAYEEVGRLRELHLVQADPKGATLELRTTKTFVEYFGIPSSHPDEIRRFLTQKLGIPSPPPSAAPEAPSAGAPSEVPPAGSVATPPILASPGGDASP